MQPLKMHGGCLLSSEPAQEPGLVSLHKTMSNTPAPSPHVKSSTNYENLQRILDNHAIVFSGLGKLNDQQVALAIN